LLKQRSMLIETCEESVVPVTLAGPHQDPSRPHLHIKVSLRLCLCWHTIHTNIMNTPGDVSPPLGPTQLAGGHAPPTPPHESALDDIYGSAPSSPSGAADEMLSDLPSRQRAHDADAYREGLSGAKGTYVQQGFDEGYALGASLGARAGYVMGVLRGFVDAWRGRDAQAHGEAVEVLERARAELAIGELLGEKWVDGEGVWKWEVEGEGEASVREVAAQHPVMREWDERVKQLAEWWGVDLRAVETSLGDEAAV
jgi:hypothetical protein